MNENQAKGIGKVIEGTAKEVAGKATGSKLDEIEGKVEKEIGRAQTKLGNKQADSEGKRPRKP